MTGKLEKIQKINSESIKTETSTDSETRGEPNNLSQTMANQNPQVSSKTPEVS